MNAQKQTQTEVRAILDEVSSIYVSGNGKLDSLIRIRELLTKIEESELIKSDISEELVYDYINLSLALKNINPSSEFEGAIFRVLSSHFVKKSVLIQHQCEKQSKTMKSIKK